MFRLDKKLTFSLNNIHILQSYVIAIFVRFFYGKILFMVFTIPVNFTFNEE